MTSSPLYRASELRRIESGAGGQPLMQRAGRAAADLSVQIEKGRGASILVLAGPGNNGGDAFEAARLLRERFHTVGVVFIGAVDTLPKDARAAWQRFADAGGSTQTTIPSGVRWSLIIDGLFGIGLKRAIGSPYAELVAHANALAERDGCPVLALDAPSGLDADTGSLTGPAIRATHTLSFIAAKPGLFTADGPDYCGRITVAPLDLEAGAFDPAMGRTIGPDLFSGQLAPRRRNSHKGSFGDAGILGGAPGMSGAVLLAARAALRLGSGRVYAGFIDANAPTVDAVYPELMLRPAHELAGIALSAIACGPGLGQSTYAQECLTRACTLDSPLVLDADALNLLADHEELAESVRKRSAPTLLTPHPAEAARLLGTTVSGIQSDRITAAHDLALRFNACIALKGCGTVVTSPEGRWFINTSGNPGLATAGSGDILSGMTTALLAQGWPPLPALLAAVHLHGCAADDLVEQGSGPIGLTAGELIDAARLRFNQWTQPRES